jgi:hypothetical protein
MSREKPYRYVVTFYVEADSQKALEAAVKYVAKHVEDGVAAYACGPYLCTCNAEAPPPIPLHDHPQEASRRLQTALQRSCSSTCSELQKACRTAGVAPCG